MPMQNTLDPDLEPLLKHICSLYINLKTHGHVGETLDYFDDEDAMDECSCQISFSIKEDLINVDVNFKEDLTKEERIIVLQKIITNLHQELFELISSSAPITIH